MPPISDQPLLLIKVLRNLFLIFGQQVYYRTGQIHVRNLEFAEFPLFQPILIEGCLLNCSELPVLIWCAHRMH
jgi:hypothetical protein